MKDFLSEKSVSSEAVYDGVLLHVRRDQVELPDGNQAVRELIRHVGAVCVVPITDEGNVLMERQFRYPMNRVILEIPAGKLDSKEEDKLEGIKRELEEETGYQADNWICLGDFYPTPAYSDEVITMFMATGLHKGVRHLDDDEFLEVEEIPLKDLVKEILDGTIADGKTQTAILKAAFITQTGK